ncbi:hypothetical protein KQ941_01835 [Paenibacillus xylanexedens]|uniref:hypothetical protein n=1 Tax=Paenibacillus xylanexedens TaxID=528191 RepID=UPI001F3C66D3|nr:hypothetical protein [Paenibacillus xylanexedens]MCF7753166.1 hypothetical protein [Paenibacillus xylanexedens]
MSENLVITVINTLFSNSPSTIFYILIALLAFWLYKQFRTYLIDNQKSNATKTEKAIEVYSELELTIRKVMQKKLSLESIDDVITKSSTYLPRELLEKYFELVEAEEEVIEDKLKVLKEKVKKEILDLKKTQFDPITYRNSGSVMEFVEMYYKTKLISLFEPFFHTVINMVIIFLTFVLVVNIAITDDWTKQIFLISLFFSGLFFLIVIDLILSEILLKNRFKHTISNWLALCLFISIPILLTIWGPWYIGIINLVLIFAYAYYAATCSIKK